MLVEAEAEIEGLFNLGELLVYHALVNELFQLRLHLVDFRLCKAGFQCPVSEAVENGAEFFRVPSAADFVERNVELLFLDLVEVYDADIDLLMPEGRFHGEPLVAADHAVRPFIPDDGFDHSKLL